MYTLNSHTQKAEMQISINLKTTWSVKQVSTQLGLCSDTCVKRRNFKIFICYLNMSYVPKTYLDHIHSPSLPPSSFLNSPHISLPIPVLVS